MKTGPPPISRIKVTIEAARSKLKNNTHRFDAYPFFIRERKWQESQGFKWVFVNDDNGFCQIVPIFSFAIRTAILSLQTISRMAESESLETGKFYRLGKDLANTEKSVRDKAVDTIRRYFFWILVIYNRELKSVQEITELEMMKLWKGLFYTFWMSDKPPVQEALATLLSDIVDIDLSIHSRFLTSEWTLYPGCTFPASGRRWSVSGVS